MTAASLGVVHTLIGPDHYLPFVVMAKARKWSRAKTIWITVLCGLGHIGSSVALGLIGIAFGLAVSHLEEFESIRGNVAAWLMIAFGLVYFVWGIRRAIRNKPHTHDHIHGDGTYHAHDHAHADAHLHVHDHKIISLTPWVLFTIFVFGPCEPLIPILIYPAAQQSLFGLILITVIFGAATILTMVTVVLVMVTGMQFFPLARMEKYSHATAGFTIFLCGTGIQFLGF